MFRKKENKKLKKPKKGETKPQKKKKFNQYFFEQRLKYYQHSPDLPSIFDFESKEVKAMLNNHRPSRFLKALGKFLYEYEMSEPKEKNSFDFSQLDNGQILEVVDEVTKHHQPTLEGYKIMKVAFYMMLLSADNCDKLHEQNPIAARANSMLSATGNRLLFAAKAAILNSLTEQEDNQLPNPLINLTGVTAAASSEEQDARERFTRSQNEERLTNNPWEYIDQHICYRCGVEDAPLDNPEKSLVEWFDNLASRISDFSRSRAVSANVFYVGPEETAVSSIKFKVEQIDLDPEKRCKSMRGQELSQGQQYPHTQEWGSLPNKLLLEYQKYHAKKHDKICLLTRVSSAFFTEMEEIFIEGIQFKVVCKEWFEFLDILKERKSPRVYNSAHLLYNHILVNKNCQVTEEDIISRLASPEHCDEALHSLETKILNAFLDKLE